MINSPGIGESWRDEARAAAAPLLRDLVYGVAPASDATLKPALAEAELLKRDLLAKMQGKTGTELAQLKGALANLEFAMQHPGSGFSLAQYVTEMQGAALEAEAKGDAEEVHEDIAIAAYTIQDEVRHQVLSSYYDEVYAGDPAMQQFMTTAYGRQGIEQVLASDPHVRQEFDALSGAPREDRRAIDQRHGENQQHFGAMATSREEGNEGNLSPQARQEREAINASLDRLRQVVGGTTDAETLRNARTLAPNLAHDIQQRMERGGYNGADNGGSHENRQNYADDVGQLARIAEQRRNHALATANHLTDGERQTLADHGIKIDPNASPSADQIPNADRFAREHKLDAMEINHRYAEQERAHGRDAALAGMKPAEQAFLIEQRRQAAFEFTARMDGAVDAARGLIREGKLSPETVSRITAIKDPTEAITALANEMKTAGVSPDARGQATMQAFLAGSSDEQKRAALTAFTDAATSEKITDATYANVTRTVGEGFNVSREGALSAVVNGRLASAGIIDREPNPGKTADAAADKAMKFAVAEANHTEEIVPGSAIAAGHQKASPGRSSVQV